MEGCIVVARSTCFLLLTIVACALLGCCTTTTTTLTERKGRIQEHNIYQHSASSAQNVLSWDKNNIPSYIAVEEDDFIQVDGLWLRDSKGKPHFIEGMNYWSCMNLGSSEAAGGNLSRLQMELDQMAAVGINHLRIMASTEGSDHRQPFRILPALQYKPGFWDEQVFLGLDRCIAEAGKRGMRLTMVMGNTWQWTGGTAQLYSWTSGIDIPYPRSWNMSSNPQRSDGYAGWGNWTKANNNEDFMRFQSQFYTDVDARNIYKGNLDQVMNRRNTITGRIYRQDATIMTWEPINEPTSATQQDKDRSALNKWYEETAHYIKSLAPNQLVTTGYESKQSEEAFREINKISAIDYACGECSKKGDPMYMFVIIDHSGQLFLLIRIPAHMWPQIWGHYDMMNSSKENVQKTIKWTKEYIMGTL